MKKVTLLLSLFLTVAFGLRAQITGIGSEVTDASALSADKTYVLQVVTHHVTGTGVGSELTNGTQYFRWPKSNGESLADIALGESSSTAFIARFIPNEAGGYELTVGGYYMPSFTIGTNVDAESGFDGSTSKRAGNNYNYVLSSYDDGFTLRHNADNGAWINYCSYDPESTATGTSAPGNQGRLWVAYKEERAMKVKIYEVSVLDPLALPTLTTDEESPVLYTILNVRRSKYATYAGESSRMTQETTPALGSLFYFTGSEADGVLTVKIHNYNTNLLCAETSSWTAEGRDWYIKAVTTTGLSISKDANFEGYSSAWNDYQGGGAVIDYWSADDAGSLWVIQPAPASLFSDVYQSTKASAQTLLENNADHVGEMFYPTQEAYDALQAAVPATDPTDATATIAAIRALETAISALNASAILPEVGKDYLIKNFYRGGYMGAKYTQPSVLTVQLSSSLVLGGYNEVSDNLSEVWTLEAGSEAGYYKFKNKETGLYIAATSTQSSSAYTVNAEGGEFKFYPNDGGRYGTTALGRGDGEKLHMDSGGTVVQWETGEASSWTFEPVDDLSGFTSSTLVSDLSAQAASVAEAFSLTQKPAYADALSAYNADPSYETATALLDATGTALGNAYYRLQSLADDRQDNACMMGTDGGNAKAHAPSNAAAGLVWQFKPVEDGYKLRNVNTDTYLGPVPGGSTSTASMYDYANGAKFTVAKQAEGDFAGSFILKDGNGRQVYNETNGNINYWFEGSGSLWTITPAEEFEVALNQVDGAGYATAYLPFPVTTLDGVTAYTGAVAGDVLRVTAVDGTVPALTGVVLEGTGETAALSIADEDAATASVEGNVLDGTCVALPVTAGADGSYDCLVLSTLDGVLGFYQPQEGTTELAANKAYIPVSSLGGSAVQGLRLSFGGTTGIGSAEAEPAADAPLYDLAGRRVVNPSKGVYIRGGKKIYVK